jgi:hypothetical protein
MPNESNKGKFFKSMDEDNIQKARMNAQHLAAKAWYDALDKLKNLEGEFSGLKITKVSSKTSEKNIVKLTTYIVEYKIPLEGVWPYRIEVFETKETVRILMTRQPSGVTDILIYPDGRFMKLDAGVTTYFEVLAEVFAYYCIDSHRVEEASEDASWAV